MDKAKHALKLAVERYEKSRTENASTQTIAECRLINMAILFIRAEVNSDE